MSIPHPLDHPIIFSQYLIILFVIIVGIRQCYFTLKKSKVKTDIIIAFGVLGLVVGLISYFTNAYKGLEAIAYSNEPSLQIIAEAMHKRFDHVVLGLVCIGLSYLFRIIIISVGYFKSKSNQ